MKGKLEGLMITAILALLSGMNLSMLQANAQVSTGHVYYGYVPPSTDVAAGEMQDMPPLGVPEGDIPMPGQVDELVKGTKINYTVPSGFAVLDIVGLEDGTNVEIWDIYANQQVNSTTIGKLERKFFYIHYGTFFKIEASARIAALLCGGEWVFEDSGGISYKTRWGGGTSTFYPAVTGGFRGKEFIFNAAPATHPYAYSADRVGYNFYLMALEKTDWSLADSTNVWSTSGSLAQRGTKTTILQSRMHHLGLNNGAGNDVVFHLTTSSDVEVSCSAIDDFVAAPAITGGYVGRLFYAPVSVTYEQAGRTGAFIVIPLEEGQVKIYDKDLNVIATHSFTTSDVSDRNYWYYDLGVGRFNLIAESTGNIAFMVGQTEGTADIGHLGDDITYIGSRPGQEIRFYAPTMAVVFATEASTVTIDGGVPVQMARDEFRLLESGVHSISADKHVIVEVLAGGAGWYDWGSYLIEPADADVSFDVPQGFLSKPVDYTMYIAGAAVAAIVAVLAVFMMRRKRAQPV